MRHEGRAEVPARRHGWLAWLRRKEWWSFEALDDERRVHLVLLAMRAFPSDYVSVVVTDLETGRRRAAERLGRVRAAPGDAVDVGAGPGDALLRFGGGAEQGWTARAALPGLEVQVEQAPRAPAHFHRLLTRRLDYRLLQFVSNEARVRLRVDGRERTLRGSGYFEHAWGVQPRHSTANWLHFWAGDAAGVVLDCRYDEGVSHAYTWVWRPGGDTYLHAPAVFTFDPDAPHQPWRVRSPDLELECVPLHSHRSRMRVPPLLPWVDIDYHEQIVTVRGRARLGGETVSLEGAGKFDHNFNRW